MLDRHLLSAELIAAAGDAGVDPASIVLFVVSEPRPAGTTPMAYLHPTGEIRPDIVAVFQAVGPLRAARYAQSAHRLAVWESLPGIPEAALGPMFRHELEHARRWERSGTAFFEADNLLRAAVREAGGRGYSALPTEVEANAASAAYAASALTAAQLAELRASRECASLLDPGTPAGDVVEETLRELERRDDWAEGADAAERAAFIAEVRAACGSWDETEARSLRPGGEGPLIEVTASFV